MEPLDFGRGRRWVSHPGRGSPGESNNQCSGLNECARGPADGKKTNESFLRRMNEALTSKWQFQPTARRTRTPPRRPSGGSPPPFDSPPYPDQDWQIGGGPNVIGDPGALRDNPFPLMQAIYDGPLGKWWYNSRIQLYGWVTVSGNLSTSHNTGPSRWPIFQ